LNLTWAAIILTGAGVILVRRELKRERPASRAAIAGGVLAFTGSACGAVSLALGPLWPLAAVLALCSAAIGAGTARIVRARAKAGAS
jgi:hypothetical protein